MQVAEFLYNQPNWFGHNPGWIYEHEPGEQHVTLFDNYGYFARISLEEFNREVIAKLPHPFTPEEMDAAVRAFMKAYETMYVCMN